MLIQLSTALLALVFSLQVTRAHEIRVEKPLLDTHLNDVIEKALKAMDIKGSALSILRPDGSSEFGSWGSSTEDGANVTSKVNFFYHNIKVLLLTAIA
jgi:hypothetical protein